MNANIAGFLRASAERHPEATCIVAGDASYTWLDIDRAVDAFAAGLVQRGLHAGDRVAMLLGNCVEFVVAYYGAARAGLVSVPLNPAYTSAEVAVLLADSGARMLIVQPSTEQVGEESSAALPGCEVVSTAERGVGRDRAVGGGRRPGRGGHLAGCAGPAAVHGGHQRPAQGRDAHARRPARQHRDAAHPHRSAGRRRRRRRARRAADVPRVRAQHGPRARRRGRGHLRAERSLRSRGEPPADHPLAASRRSPEPRRCTRRGARPRGCARRCRPSACSRAAARRCPSGCSSPSPSSPACASTRATA